MRLDPARVVLLPALRVAVAFVAVADPVALRVVADALNGIEYK